MAENFLVHNFSDQYKDPSYPDYRTDFHHDIDEGLLLLPVAGPPGTPPKIVRTHAPYMTKRASWVAEKINDKPTLPHWDTSNPNDILVQAHWQPMSPVAGLGFYVFACRGTYTYVSAVAPSKDNLVLPMGAPVNVNRSSSDNTFTIGLFDRNVLRSPGNFPGGQIVSR